MRKDELALSRGNIRRKKPPGFPRKYKETQLKVRANWTFLNFMATAILPFFFFYETGV